MLTKKGVQCVYLFFTVSGFVLPLGYFKNPQKSKLASAIYRRYSRLMLPILVTYSLTYLIHSMFVNSYENSVTLNFSQMLYASFFGVWKGEESSIFPWNPALWTIFIEFWASFVIYGIALLSFEYETMTILYLSIIIFCWAGNMNEFIMDIAYDKNIQMMPFFIIGMMMADDEIRGGRLQKIRKMNLQTKSMVYLIASVVILLEFNDEFRQKIDPNYSYRWFYFHFAPFFVVMICLTSDWAQFILNSSPF
jgi:peptidoglycan/LPS O-acetylase OafA/YrhL